MHHRIHAAKSLEQWGVIRDVGDNQGNSIDEFEVARGKVVVDNYVMARCE
jgi:IS4 transposase